MSMTATVSLARRFACMAAMLASVALLAVTGISLWLIDREHEASLRKLMAKDAELQAAMVGSSLHGLAGRMNEIAQSSLIANALVDSAGKEAYLVPFLNGIQRVHGIPVSILFADFAGDEIARNSVGNFGERERAWLREALRESKPSAIVIDGPAGEELLAADFVLYSRSNAAEGALMYKIRLADIPRQSSVKLVRGAQARDAMVDGSASAMPVDSPTIYRDLQFAVVAHPGNAHPGRNLWPFFMIFLFSAGVGGIVITLGVHLGKKMTAELRTLDAFSREVAQKGFGTGRVHASGSLEVASLSDSINRMLDRLNEQHDKFQHESEERYRLLVEGTSAISFEMSLPDFRYEFVSPQVKKVFGLPLRDWQENGFWQAHVWPEDRGMVEDLHGDVVRYGGNYRCEYRLTDALGVPVWVEEIGSVLADESGRPLALRGILLDIRERKDAEQRVLGEYDKVNRMKNEFISTVSHELRTPLTSIRGTLGLVLAGVRGELPVQARHLLDLANQSCEHLIRLINDILDVEKIESGKVEFLHAHCELRTLLERSISANKAFGEQYGVQFRLAGDLPDVVVDVDADRFSQVMTNLLSNAAKFSHENGDVTVSAQLENGMALIQVCDHGTGIPLEFYDKIFQKFSQADSSDARHREGTGLGLSICKSIVERMGGRIGFSSELGKGTTFHFLVPVGKVRPCTRIAA